MRTISSDANAPPLGRAFPPPFYFYVLSPRLYQGLYSTPCSCSMFLTQFHYLFCFSHVRICAQGLPVVVRGPVGLACTTRNVYVRSALIWT
jgi:hypothetical protein